MSSINTPRKGICDYRLTFHRADSLFICHQIDRELGGRSCEKAKEAVSCDCLAVRLPVSLLLVDITDGLLVRGRQHSRSGQCVVSARTRARIVSLYTYFYKTGHVSSCKHLSMQLGTYTCMAQIFILYHLDCQEGT